MVPRRWDDQVEQAFTARTNFGENSMKTSKKSKKTIQKKAVLQKKAEVRTNNKTNKAKIKIKKAIPKIETTKAKVKAKTKVQIKIKKAAPRAKGKSQVKTKAELTTKAKPNAQTKTGKVSAPEDKVKAPIKTKKVMSSSEVIIKINKPTKQATKEIVSQKQNSMEAVIGPVDVQPYRLEKNEEYMNKKQLDHFRTILQQWKERLMEDAEHAMHRLQDEASNHPDPIDRASKEEEFGLELHTRDRKRKFLKKIEETLVRFNNGSYGYCDDCGAEIGIHRLEVHPTATQCIDCRIVTETKEKQIGEAAVTKDSIQD